MAIEARIIAIVKQKLSNHQLIKLDMKKIEREEVRKKKPETAAVFANNNFYQENSSL